MNKIIISDASCLIALSNIGQLNILKDLFKEIIITEEVKDEFGDELPFWIKTQAAKDIGRKKDLEAILDKGEASSIALSLEIENSLLIIDESKGRKIANSLNLQIIGTIGVLILANKKGLIKDLISVILKLVNKGFRLSDSLVSKIIDQYGMK
jgi:predicted nucleic acid-binding protein